MGFNRKKTFCRKLGTVVLAVILTLAVLSGCGNTTPTTADDPNIGIWAATKVEVFDIESSVEEVFEGGFEIELMAKDKCELRFGGQKNTYKWAIEDNTLTINLNGAEIISANITGGVMVIDDYMGLGIKITLTKDGTGANNQSDADSTLSSSEAGYYVIDSMTIGEEHYDLESLKDMGISYYIRLNEDNTAEISTDTLINGSWEDGEIRYRQDGEGVANEYVLEGDTLTIEIIDGDSQATLVFKRSSESGAQAMWGADWYGYIWVTEGFGSFENDEEFFADAYLFINIDETGTGTLEIILDGDDENMVEAAIVSDENHFEVTEGFFWDMQLDPSQWWIALSPGSEGKMFVIGDTYTDPEGGENRFEYMFCFRPYGEPWDQEERENDRVPPGYETLYKDDWSLGSDVSAPDMEDDNNGGDTTGAPVDAGPHFTSAELKEIYTKLNKDYDDRTLSGQSYQEVCDKYFDGIAGTLDLKGNTLTIYKWFAADQEGVYVQVSFQDYSGDGNRTAGGIGSYFP